VPTIGSRQTQGVIFAQGWQRDPVYALTSFIQRPLLAVLAKKKPRSKFRVCQPISGTIAKTPANITEDRTRVTRQVEKIFFLSAEGDSSGCSGRTRRCLFLLRRKPRRRLVGDPSTNPFNRSHPLPTQSRSSSGGVQANPRSGANREWAKSISGGGKRNDE